MSAQSNQGVVAWTHPSASCFAKGQRTLTQTMRTWFSPLILLAMLLLFLSSPAAASAQTPSFGIRPQEVSQGYFQYTMAPGERVQDGLVANNSEDTPLTLTIRTVQGVTMAAGGISFAEDSSGPAQWVRLAAAGSVVVPAQTAVTLPFEVTVPADTPPGEYVVGFVARSQALPEAQRVEAETDAQTSSFHVQVISEVGVAMIITVLGDSRCEAALSALHSASDKGRWQLALGLQNTGNVHFKGSGEVVARPAGGGDPVARRPFEVGYFIPGDTIAYPLFLEPYPAAGEYQVEVNLLTDCGFATTFTQPVSISRAEVQQAAAEVLAEGQPSPVADQAALLLAQAALMRSIGLLLTGIAALVVAGAGVVIMRRRRSAQLANPFTAHARN